MNDRKNGLTYADSGVDIDAGNRLVDLIKPMVRATARAVADRLQGARDRALYYRDVVLPLQEMVVNEAQLHYNAMQLGPIELLRAREQQIETAVTYVAALRDYWIAYGDYQQLMIGRVPQTNGMSRSATSMPPAAEISAGH